MSLVTLPLEAGFLLYQGWKLNGRPSLEGVILFREPVPGRTLAGLTLGLLAWAAVASTLMAPVDEALRRFLFAWWPASLNTSMFVQQLDLYSSPVLWTVALGSLVLNIVVPVVEELYFRGYLLPRMARWGWLAPLSSLLLFSLYHFWIPWQNPSRLVALLPAVLVVFRRRNVKLSILVHVLLNSLGSLALIVMLIGR
jgi:membrane protease YdiL (CAAX protease family)